MNSLTTSPRPADARILRISRAQRVLLGAYAIAAAVNVVASGFGGQIADTLTKPLLMPLLAATVALARPVRRDRGLIGGGLVAATAGDIALMNSSTPAFLGGMALFLACHACYISAFVRGGAITALRGSRRGLAIRIGYALLVVAALTIMWNPLGGLAAPIALYACALATMAACASAYGWWTGIGGALFLLSDMLIAVRITGVRLPAHDVWVMLTYVLGQGLIATGWLRRDTAIASTTAAGTADAKRRTVTGPATAGTGTDEPQLAASQG